MKKILFNFIMILVCATAVPLGAQEEPADGQPYPASIELKEKDSGWFIGTDQGVLFFVGTSGNFMSPQFYSSIFGGYDIKGYVQPILRISSAFGNTDEAFPTTTFFFMMEGGVRFTPLRTKFRPYFISTVGFYFLDFPDFAFPIASDTNFTFTAGGGLEYKFGSGRINIGSEYRGMLNDRIDLRGVQVTLGYIFQF